MNGPHPTTTRRGRLSGPARIVVWAVIGMHPTVALAQPAETSDRVYGLRSCVQCHRTAEGNVYTTQSHGHVRLDEFTVWSRQDKHALSYCVLEGPLGRRMAQLLGYDVRTDTRCTSCHAPLAGRLSMNDMSPAAEGVGCEVCHGAAEQWYGPHQFASWRKLSAAEKQSEYGLRDLIDPVQHSRLCVSCHVGDRHTDRVVTHDMYAAGHPPLPSVELAHYSQQMPRHWMDPTEQGEFANTRLALIGAVVAWSASIDLISTPATDSADWPELSHFDCQACHHDLAYPSWRQQRGFLGRPGRPRPRASPVPLVELSAKLAGHDLEPLDDRLAPLLVAFDQRPFGDPAAVRSAAGDLVDFSDRLLLAVSAARLDETAARATLLSLCEIAVGEPPDYDTARQMAWALETIYADLYPDREAWESRAAVAFASLDEQLRLSFPPRDEADVTDESWLAPFGGETRCAAELTEGPVTAALPAALRTMADYRPEAFQRAVAALAASLAPR